LWLQGACVCFFICLVLYSAAPVYVYSP
jgi:hypothetical protein